MKKSLLSILLLSSMLFSSQIEKMTLLYVEMDYCPWCKKMDIEVFENNSKLDRLKKFYVIKRVKKGDSTIPSFIQTKFYPTTYILSSDKNKIIDELPGYMKAEDYVDYLETLFEVENQ